MNIEKTIKSLERGGYTVTFFKTGAEAVSYLEGSIENKTIGFGGSRTLTDLHLLEILRKKIWTRQSGEPETLLRPRMRCGSTVRHPVLLRRTSAMTARETRESAIPC
ncbi:MAG: LUD domain-containing protein [bacterium]|nr:LUD domain-containing protein [bacterium]